MTLRIAWLGPWNANSAIAKFGLEVVGELKRRGHEVNVYRTETGRALTLPLLHDGPNIHRLTSKAAKRARRQHDIMFANLGDNYEFHGGITDTLGEVEAIGIFHDGFLLNLANGYLHRKKFRPNQRLEFFRSIYGPSAVAIEPLMRQPNLERLADIIPCTEWLAPLVNGAIVHSDVWTGRVAARCPGPVAQLALPYPDIGALPLQIERGKVRIATFGRANANKRIDEVMKAIASSDRLQSTCSYAIYGEAPKDERGRITELARQLGVDAPKFSGWVDDAKFAKAMAATDVVACLRYPILEGGSASLVTAMLSGRPILVSDHGHYRLPEGLALPCRPGDESADIARHLNWVLDNPDGAAEMGRRARQFALAEHSVARYVDGLLALAEKSIGLAPTLKAARKFGHFIGQIGGAADDPVIDRIISCLSPSSGERSSSSSEPVQQ